MSLKTGLLVAALSSCLFCARSAAADGAKTLYQTGRAAYALGKYAEAADAFEHAFELKHDPAILFNAAQAHRLAGNQERALRLYQSYLHLYGDEVVNREARDEAQRHISELTAAVEAEKRSMQSPSQDLAAPAAEPVHSAPPSVVETAPAPRRKPLTRQAWFWGTVGGAVVVVGVAIGLGVGLGVGNRPHDPSPSLGAVQY